MPFTRNEIPSKKNVKVFGKKRRPKRLRVRGKYLPHYEIKIYAIENCLWALRTKEGEALCNGCAFLTRVQHPSGGSRHYCETHRSPRFLSKSKDKDFRIDDFPTLEMSKYVRR